MEDKKVLVCGGGIAGLTVGSLLAEKGWTPVIIERDTAMRTEGYMLDFAGSGWDVAERMGITDALRSVHYPIERMEYVDANGKPYISVPIDRIRKALGGRYVYLRRPDLERILLERVLSQGVEVRFGTTVCSLTDSRDGIEAEFDNGASDTFSIAIGADGVHSKLRELEFGAEDQFARFLGYYVAAFHAKSRNGVDDAVKLFEEPDRVAFFYPLDARSMDATLVFRHKNVGSLQHAQRLAFVKKQFRGAGWITQEVLADQDISAPLFFDSLTQIVLPRWTSGRVALVGDACGCLTLIAGQGSHMAMAGAYVLADQLDRHGKEYRSAFDQYEKFMKPWVTRKQKDAVRLSTSFVPSTSSRPSLRHGVMKLMFSRALLGNVLSLFGVRSILEHYRG